VTPEQMLNEGSKKEVQELHAENLKNEKEKNDNLPFDEIVGQNRKETSSEFAEDLNELTKEARDSINNNYSPI